MDRCMNRTDLPKGSSKADKDDDTVSIEEIGYPALIDQVKSRRCLEEYMVYSERFLQQQPRNRCGPLSFGMIELLASLLLLSSTLLLQ